MNVDGEQSAQTIGDDHAIIRNVLGELHPTATSNTGSNGNVNGMYSWQDPQIYFKSLNANSSKEH